MLRFFALLTGLAMAVCNAHAVVWPEGLPAPLTDNDVARYKRLFAEADAGNRPSDAVLHQVENEALVGHVLARYYLRGNGSVAEMAGWLKRYSDLPEAVAIYKKAAAMRSTSRKVTERVKNKHGKWVTRTRTVRTEGTTEGLQKPAVLIAREQRVEEFKAKREAEYDGLSADVAAKRRQILGSAWQASQRGDWDRSMSILEAPGARDVVGAARWQSMMVAIADHYMQKREWSDALRVARRAAEVSGPDRDEARWMAGMASYRLGRMEDASRHWQNLVREEPVGGPHYARAAWWAARAFTQQGDRGSSRTMLEAASKDITTFYGQLALAQLGDGAVLEWRTPSLDKSKVRSLMRIPAAQRGLALAQLGEVALSQQEFRLAQRDLPYDDTDTLAALGVQLGLPALALQAGKELKERGTTWLAPLYPLPTWKPLGRPTVSQPLVLAIMRQESAFHPAIGSSVGAQGLMQLMPKTAALVARGMGRSAPSNTALHEPSLNITLGQNYLRHLDEVQSGNLLLVIASYNAGPGNVGRWFKRGWVTHDDPVLFIESIPFKETKDYTEKVLANLWLYEQRLGGVSGSLKDMAKGNWPKPGVSWDGSWSSASN
ncbi:MAG TPA: lytic transglycosylase domain-containing protein [Alphaproteobacteria bacterium]|nr:lytic transglycosylase domain-containing protein [Alphaproteobacteria bacterium]